MLIVCLICVPAQLKLDVVVAQLNKNIGEMISEVSLSYAAETAHSCIETLK